MVSKLLLDLLGSPTVVVALLVLLSLFGILVITATPVYQVPARLAALRDQLLGRTVPDEEAGAEEDTATIRAVAATGVASERSPTARSTPTMGDPAYDTPVLEGREFGKRGRKKPLAEPESEPRRPSSSRRPTTRCPPAPSS